jgi:predicted metal-dependent phosphotriesterase family hydrolase
MVEADGATVMTVRGRVPVRQLGPTLMHEHIFLNLMREHRATGLLQDFELMRNELQHFVDVGGRSVVECTSLGLGRRPAALRDISERTGLNIIMGTGFYREPYLDHAWMDSRSVDDLAELIVQDLEVGTDGTEIRAGIIGEVGTDGAYPTAVEERSIRAAARAHRRTGVTISTHAARWPVGLAQLDLLAEEGVDPRGVIVGHVETVPSFDYHLELIRRGAWVQYDSIRGQSPHDRRIRIERVVELLRLGHGDQLLLSHDVCNQTHLINGGGTGYSYIHTEFRADLRRAGVGDEEFEQLTITNPQRALSPHG